MFLTRELQHNDNITKKFRLSQKEKNQNDNMWYREKAEEIDTLSNSVSRTSIFMNDDTGISEFRRMKSNYDLFNNIINIKDLEYVVRPFGDDVGELPAKFANRDIVSGKIKVLLGMELDMPFDFTAIATNEEATTRKEQQETKMIKDYVVSQIMSPIRTQEELAAREKLKGQELSPEEKQSIQQEIEANIQAKTPDEVLKYLSREHTDPTEKLINQIAEYLVLEQNIKDKVSKGFKHVNLSGKEVYRITERNNKPVLDNINSLYFDNELSRDHDFIEDSEWARYESKMSVSQIITSFSNWLDDSDIDRIMDNSNQADSSLDFTFDDEDQVSQGFLRVVHYNFRALDKVCFLSYFDNKGKPKVKLVDENYKLNKELGDIAIHVEWIPGVHECYRIFNDLYVCCRPTVSQPRDIYNLYENPKLDYYGATVDDLNSKITAPMDRMKDYQYLYDIIIYRIELLMASDEGKMTAINLNSVPKSMGIDIDKFKYFMKANKIIWLNPNEEGNRGGGEITNMAKELDLSLVSDIAAYMNLADSIEAKCGNSIGVTKTVEAQIQSQDAVTNTKQNLVQSSHILRPWFALHNSVKRNIMQGLVDKAIVIYSTIPNEIVETYVLDDMSSRILRINPEQLKNARCYIFMADSQLSYQAKQAVTQLAETAMQNQQADILDVLKVIKAKSINDAEEQLTIARDKADKKNSEIEQNKTKALKDIEDRRQKLERDKWVHEEKIVILKEEERRKTVIQAQAIESIGFDPNKDEDNDGTPDVLEIAKFGVDAEIKRGKIENDRNKLELDREKFEHDREYDKEKLKIENKKVSRLNTKG